MILHKYTDKNGINILKSLELKCSIPSKFNDPFEILAKPDENWDETKYLKYIEKFQDFVIGNRGENYKKYITKKTFIDSVIKDHDSPWERINNIKTKADDFGRILCFSSAKDTTDPNQILMWSHYADKHTGLRFHFDSQILDRDNNKIAKVQYSNFRASFATSNLIDKTLSDAMFKDIILTKSEAWHYEEEYRIIEPLKNCTEKIIDGEKMYFVRFDPKSLIRIDLGLFSDSQLKDTIIEELKRNELKHISLFQAKINPDEYKLDYQAII
jgi:hypothetical protein